MTGESKVIPVYAIKAYVGVEEYLHSFLNSFLYTDECSALGKCHLTTREGPPTSTRYEAGWAPEMVETLW